jgi:tetratricopeptide (TPR) repeat protein
MLSTWSRRILAIIIVFILPALALWKVVQWDWVAVTTADGKLKIEDIIEKIFVLYVGLAGLLAWVVDRIGLTGEPRLALVARINQLRKLVSQSRISGSISSDAPDPDFYFRVVSPEQLPSEIGDFSHPDVPYVNRLPASEQNQMLTVMQESKNLLIIGRSGLGKTREAIELVRRIENETGEEVSVLLPLGALVVPLSIPRNKLKRNVVLFLDNLHGLYGEPNSEDNLNDPRLIEGDFRVRFRETIRVFEESLGIRFRIVATAIGLPESLDKLSLKDPFWKSFTIYHLPDLVLEQRGDLLNKMEQYLGVRIAEDAKDILAKRSDGTFCGLTIPIIIDRRKKKITAEDAQTYTCTYPKDWKESVYPKVFADHPHRNAILSAVSILRQAGMKEYPFLVVDLAARLVSSQSLFWHRLRVKKALLEVYDWVPISKAGIISCNQAYLVTEADVSKDKDSLLECVFDLLRSRKHVQALRPSLYELIDCLLLKLNDSFNAVSIYQWMLKVNPDNARARNRLASLYLKLGQLDEAEDQCIQAIGLVSRPDSWVVLASICSAQKQFQAAKRACEIGIDKNPNRYGYWICMAVIQGELKDYEGAVKSSLNAVHLGRRMPLAHTCLAIAYEQAGQYHHAIRQGWFAVSLNPDSSSAWRTLGVTYSRAKCYEDAVRAGTKAVEISPNNAKAWGLLARSKEEAGYDDYLPLYEKAVGIAPFDADLKLSYGIALQKASRMADAKTVLEEAVSLGSNNAKAHLTLGCLLLDMEEYAGAETAFRRALLLNPNSSHAHGLLAKTLLRSRKLAEALIHARMAVDIDQDSPEAHFGLAMVFFEQRDYLNAELEFRIAVDLNPEFAYSYSYLASTLSGQGRDIEALDNAKRAAELSSDNSSVLFGLGLAHLKLGDFEGAETAFRRAIELREDFVLAYNYLVGALIERKKIPEALEFASKAVKLAASKSGSWFGLGRALLEAKDLKGAEEAFRKAIELRPGFSMAYSYLISALFEQADKEEALRIFSSNKNISAKILDYIYSAGKSLVDAGKFDEAIKKFLQVIYLNPDYALAYSYMGNAHLHAGHHEEAEAAYRQALLLDSHNPYYHFGLATVLQNKGDAQQAEIEYREAVRLKPGFVEANSYLTKILAQQGKWNEVYQIEQTLSQIDPERNKISYGPALSAVRSGDYVLAEELFRKVLKYHPENARAHQHLGDLLLNLGREDEAPEELKMAVDLDPTMSKAWYLLGKSLLRKRKYVEAGNALEESVRLKSGFAPAHEELGRAFEGQGKLIDASRCYTRALELDPECRYASERIVELSRATDPGGIQATYTQERHVDLSLPT